MINRAITVENLSKFYRLGLIGGGTLREDLNRLWAQVRGKPDPLLKVGMEDQGNRKGGMIWALRNINLEVKEGEILGIIGRNGAGKSTLLKILSRITAPTEGRATIRGRVGSLLEVGTGFHPELTGRENIYLNGTILGMRRVEVTSKLEEIVEFAEMGRFIDTPVKRYSSGMTVRLAFAVAAHLEPEVLLVDEVLAVGDAAFQKKCLGKMGDVAKDGRTILFVSHNMTAIMALCPQSLWIDGGKIVRRDNSPDVVRSYLENFQLIASQKELRDRQDRKGSGTIQAVGLHFGTMDRPESGYWITGQDCIVNVCYECSENTLYRNIEFALAIKKLDQTPLLYIGTKVVHQDLELLNGSSSSVCTIKRLPLEPGQYSLTVEIKQNGIIVDHVDYAAAVDVADGDYYGTGVIWPYGGFLCDYSWAHDLPDGHNIDPKLSLSQTRSIR